VKLTRAILCLTLVTVVLAGIGARVLSRAPLLSGAAATQERDIDLEDDVADADHEPALPSFDRDVAPFLAQYCQSCHAREKPKGKISLEDQVDELSVLSNPQDWQRVAQAVRQGRMPPAKRPQPERRESELFLRWLDRALDQAGSERPAQPAVSLRRLNRSEYNNTICDLVGVPFRPADDFPPDDTSEGFDTIGATLSLSPTLIEKYLSAAETVIERAASDPSLWQRIASPPLQDFIPYALRGTPPQKADAVKDLLPDRQDDAAAQARSAEIDRAYAALQAFADRAYRRPITHAEINRLMHFVEATLEAGQGVDPGLKQAFQAVLVSSHFLFRIESEESSLAPNRGRRLSDFELATRLSYFLWSSMPDEELFKLAALDQLHEPKTLVRQVRRMLQNPRAFALTENFAGQWLQTRALTEVTRDHSLFPSFDEELRDAMRRESELFFDDLVRHDRSVLDLVGGEYAYVNERLARHYGIGMISGPEFRRVSLAGTGRAGVLTQGSLLCVTSGPTATSPVKRGKWILENFLGMSVPPPPPGFDTLARAQSQSMSLRQRLELHRSKSECASCHARMDPLGFGLENFDACGAWRDRDGGVPIDASGTLPNGRSFRGPAELRSLLLEQPDVFLRCFTEKLMVYALGRSLTLTDRAAVDGIVRRAARNDYRFSSLVIALVRSEPFTTKQAGGEP
jgi:Protein of unknown function (DUF1592)/Protein of unknown function (DUF1588)/Protein of unknown function (DUF1585)/Protein of unknown function (DUF1587)/Protein of unknown function (DUF1595)